MSTRPNKVPEGDEDKRPQPDLERTQPSTPERSTRQMPPVPPPVAYVPPPRLERKRKPRQRPPNQRDSGLYLPLWSVGLMLITVLGIAFGLVLLVVALGGQAAPGGEPRIVIITAEPSITPPFGQSVLASPTFPPETGGGSGPSFAMQGPTLPPVVFTPTPDVVAAGKTVIVYGTQEQQLNVRDNPGVNTNVLFRVPDGYSLTVVEGPSQADGLFWWKVQDPANPSLSGWVASDYIQVASR